MTRTRFAPSPTGYMHIGNLRTALYAYLIAKSQEGSFILRIEDTDQDRYVEGAVDIILSSLEKAGLAYDEGPGVGGDYGPYIQSQRKSGYMDYAKRLIESGHAYYCFCTKERLEKLKSEEGAYRYDGHCATLSEEEVASKLASGIPYVIRQRMPREGVTVFTDAVYGEISVDNAELEDQILIKSDGMPTYNFANVIDDHLMGITHVLRGSEYLSSTPKYSLLYQAFGWEEPIYVHLPLITKEGGKKLSKREGDASFEDLMAQGYLPEAIVNYIVLLGWSPGDDREFFTLQELTEAFSVEGINKSPSVFDINKLRWMNGEYIRKRSPEAFHEAALPWIRKAVKRQDIDTRYLAGLLHQRTEVLSDIVDMVDFVDRLPDYGADLYLHKKQKCQYDNSLENLKAAREALSALPEWTQEAIHDSLFARIESMGIKTGQMMWPVRTALSGKAFSPGGGVELAVLLGREETLKRIDAGISILEKAIAAE
jgi:glutamyl-tRNA synthetase